MTLTPEQIKEAVRLADGWSWIADMVADANGIAIAMNQNYGIAALASQLISQVDAMDGCSVSVSEECATAFHPSGYFQHGYNQHNRDENSILACTEFLREKGNE